MAIEGLVNLNYEWLSPSRLRVLRELTDGYRGHQAADRAGLSYGGYRGALNDIENFTGCSDAGEVIRRWRANRHPWAAWVLAQGGVSLKGTDRR